MAESGFLRELADYLRTHRRAWLVSFILLVVALVLVALALYGPGALLSGVYQDF